MHVIIIINKEFSHSIEASFGSMCHVTSPAEDMPKIPTKCCFLGDGFCGLPDLLTHSGISKLYTVDLNVYAIRITVVFSCWSSNQNRFTVQKRGPNVGDDPISIVRSWEHRSNPLPKAMAGIGILSWKQIKGNHKGKTTCLL